MATNPIARTNTLQAADWVAAALARFADQGIEAVRIELLARDLNASKGSFYWHFRDRGELLEMLLDDWERSELLWFETEGEFASAADRWARYVERAANPQRVRVEVALRAWARQDERVAHRLTAVERKQTGCIASVLREVGFQGRSAELWSEIVHMVCLGWSDRAMRDREFYVANRGLGEFLSEVLLAASIRPVGARV
jgi:AcrR family transcriptional regulator